MNAEQSRRYQAALSRHFRAGVDQPDAADDAYAEVFGEMRVAPAPDRLGPAQSRGDDWWRCDGRGAAISEGYLCGWCLAGDADPDLDYVERKP